MDAAQFQPRKKEDVMRRRLAPVFVVLILAADAAMSQTVTMGRLYADGGLNYVLFSVPPFTIVDTMHPATGTGLVSRAVVRWVGQPNPCPNAFKLRFVHPSGSVTNFVTVAERGPFPGVHGRNDLTLNPPVPVGPGDLLGIT